MYRRQLNLGIAQGTLVDLETTGLNPFDNELVAFGYIHGSGLCILCRRSPEESSFVEEVRELVRGLSPPFYAYNLSFEERFLMARGIAIQGYDLFRPWATRAEQASLKWPKLDELISHPEGYFGEKVVSGQDVPRLWRRFMETGNENCLQAIIRHNEADLLREMYLLLHYPLERLPRQE